MKFQMKNIEGWQDFLELGVASWLVISPFVLGFFENVNATLSVMFAGCFVILFSVLGLATHKPWDEWLNIIVAAFLITSPWLIGFATLNIVVANVVVSGVILILLAAYTLKVEYREIQEATDQLHSH